MRLLARHPISQQKLNYKEEHYREGLQTVMPHYPDINDWAKRNLKAIGEVFKG
jgi:hypothetical protein